jgi:nicotinate-nucleotide adenylyltransferase
MKIGILGGTFNPIHLGHLHLALEVHSTLNLDEILLIPTGIPPHKPDEKLALPSSRLEMVRMAIKGYPFLHVSDIEIRRPTPSYSIDTVRALKKGSPGNQFYFIIGLDAFLEIESWREPHVLLEMLHFVVVSRPGFQFRQLTRLPFLSRSSEKELGELDLDLKNRLEMQINPFPTLILLRIEPYPISSSEIREKIKKGEDFDNNLLPESVKSFIMKKKIFSE